MHDALDQCPKRPDVDFKVAEGSGIAGSLITNGSTTRRRGSSGQIRAVAPISVTDSISAGVRGIKQLNTVDREGDLRQQRQAVALFRVASPTALTLGSGCFIAATSVAWIA